MSIATIALYESFQVGIHALPCELGVVSAELLSIIFNISSTLVTRES